MSNNGLPAQNGNVGASPEAGEPGLATLPVETLHTDTVAGTTGRYSDLQSAARFPIKLPISLKSKAGESHTESENISANGVLFHVDAEMPVGAALNFTISLPAAILGAETDVQVDCRGRVVRSVADGSRRNVGVVIDEYRFERH